VTTVRTQAWRFGRFAETVCVWCLRLQGYRVLARRYRSPVGEIDIVAKRGRIVVIVEVKARADATSAVEALSLRQRQRIARAAGAFLQAHPALAGCDVRFDAIALTRWQWPLHLRDAWRPDRM
jgi:putative endonuclease